jgi:hypothetical protein
MSAEVSGGQRISAPFDVMTCDRRIGRWFVTANSCGMSRCLERYMNRPRLFMEPLRLELIEYHVHNSGGEKNL